MNTTRSTFYILLAALIWVAGCATPVPTPDPLKDWTFRTFDDFAVPGHEHHYRLDKVITDDYQDFISKNKLGATPITGFFEDGTGQHAVEFEAFEIGANVKRSEMNASWRYVLIYDKENVRIKVIKYGRIKYQS